MEHFNLKDRLHTDVLEERYDRISTKVVRHDDKVRECHLVDSNGISRTYAITLFLEEHEDEEVVSIDKEIREGKPIGKTFRENGYEIRKNVIGVYSEIIPEQLRHDFGVVDRHAKVRVSEFYAKRENKEPIIYGTVAEIYSPDFRDPSINDVDLEQVSPATKLLQRLDISKEDIWSSLCGDTDLKFKTNPTIVRESSEYLEQIKRKIGIILERYVV